MFYADLLKAFLFGFTIAMAIGPIAILIINTSLQQGVKQGAACAFGVALADFSFALVTLLVGVQILGTVAKFKDEINLISSGLLVIIGCWLIGSAITKYTTTSQPQTNPKTKAARHKIWQFYLLTIANPMTVIVFMAFTGQIQTTLWWYALLMAFFVFMGSFLAQIILALCGAWLKRYLRNKRILLILNAMSGVLIILFGLLW